MLFVAIYFYFFIFIVEITGQRFKGAPPEKIDQGSELIISSESIGPIPTRVFGQDAPAP